MKIWTTKSVKFYEIIDGKKEENPFIWDVKISNKNHINRILESEQEGSLHIVEKKEGYVNICPVCGSYMRESEEDKELQHSSCPLCGYYENIYGPGIDICK